MLPVKNLTTPRNLKSDDLFTLDLFAPDAFKIMLSKSCFQRVVLSGNYEILAISTDKNIFLMTLIIKLTLGNLFITVKNAPRGATFTKYSKLILKLLYLHY